MAGARPGSAIVAIAVAVAVVLAGCGVAVPPDAVARIGDDPPIRYSEFEDYLRINAGEAETLNDAVRRALLTRFLDERVLERWAVDQRLAVRGEPPREVIESVLRRFPPDEPSPEEITATFMAHADRYRRPERLRVRQVLCARRSEAERARDALRAGGDLETAVRAASLSRADSGIGSAEFADLAREDLPAELAEVLFRLAPGSTSDVIEAAQGFHVFQLLERRPADGLTLEEAAPRVREELAALQADRKVAQLVREARGHYNVQVYERNLPFALDANEPRPPAPDY
jgi:parvulin-like peptidyl-prolyl isomerase